ncbi:hypothetical protein A605_03580 [Corynebacterium halotolerans YIM 70093 = DSM 44683]|uniref:Uncharacterized protein n=1 Tax=Corynebacterium halotolerans YIM 70093 = DSM 44683 TaxID=1121362 RepID=M1NQE1_9CORY|nr:hypothetical protein A605_03580 [Corynebacterium halotolerans YIM 70093 = DSM 44683]
MGLILDTDDDILVATDAGDMARQLIGLLDDEPDDETLTRLAAVVLGCDVLDVIIIRTTHP